MKKKQKGKKRKMGQIGDLFRIPIQRWGGYPRPDLDPDSPTPTRNIYVLTLALAHNDSISLAPSLAEGETVNRSPWGPVSPIGNPHPRLYLQMTEAGNPALPPLPTLILIDHVRRGIIKYLWQHSYRCNQLWHFSCFKMHYRFITIHFHI